MNAKRLVLTLLAGIFCATATGCCGWHPFRRDSEYNCNRYEPCR